MYKNENKRKNQTNESWLIDKWKRNWYDETKAGVESILERRWKWMQKWYQSDRKYKTISIEVKYENGYYIMGQCGART